MPVADLTRSNAPNLENISCERNNMRYEAGMSLAWLNNIGVTFS